MCVCGRGNVFTQRCRATIGNTHTHTETDGTIYKVDRWDGLRRHDIHTKFHENWFSRSEVDRQHSDRINLTLFFQNKKRRLKWIHILSFWTFSIILLSWAQSKGLAAIFGHVHLLSNGPKWVALTWRRRQNEASETLCFQNKNRTVF
jgi:hypothetical protein